MMIDAGNNEDQWLLIVDDQWFDDQWLVINDESSMTAKDLDDVKSVNEVNPQIYNYNQILLDYDS